MKAQLSAFILTTVLIVSVFAQNQPQSPTVDSKLDSKLDSKEKLTDNLDLTPTSTQSNSTNTKAAIKTAPGQKNTNTFKRDPFRLPKYLIDKITYKPPPPIIENQVIDDRVEPIMRWPAKEYLLVGIIWEVQSPKALIKDLQGRVHVVKLRDRLGNKDGIVTAIKEGAITVTEKKFPLVLRLKK